MQGLPEGETFTSLHTTPNGGIFVLSESGKVYAWGDNMRGQLGIDPQTHPKVAVPTQIV